jgi:hypothetical protein
MLLSCHPDIPQHSLYFLSSASKVYRGGIGHLCDETEVTEDEDKDTSLLGSLKPKTTTRINLQFNKLGLMLNSDKSMVLNG